MTQSLSDTKCPLPLLCSGGDCLAQSGTHGKTDPEYDEKMAKIAEAKTNVSEKHPVFYEDEVDIDLNPKIGADWCFKGRQKRVITPGKNEKHFLAGCLNAQTEQTTYVKGIKNNSDLFIKMLDELNHQYPHAKTLILILDNDCIHKSHKVKPQTYFFTLEC